MSGARSMTRSEGARTSALPVSCWGGPQPWTLEQGLEQAVEWCRRSGWAGDEHVPVAAPVTPVA
jgi:hypothetical protein